MKQEIKNNELRERQSYVPASVKVIEVNAQKVLCISGDTSNDEYTNIPNPSWF